MSKVLTKQVQNKISRYFLQLDNHLTRPELRCIREMTTGILKSGKVLVNKIATYWIRTSDFHPVNDLPKGTIHLIPSSYRIYKIAK
jgi:hypothetical protein